MSHELKLLRFPSIDEIEEPNEKIITLKIYNQEKTELSREEKIQRILRINYSTVNDTSMVKQIDLGNGENKIGEPEKKRGGVARHRNEDEFIDCYFCYVNAELKGRNSSIGNRGQILNELRNYLSKIASLRSGLKSGTPSVSGSMFIDSLKIGELKRNFRSLMAYYLKVKEGLVEIENEAKNYYNYGAMASGY